MIRKLSKPSLLWFDQFDKTARFNWQEKTGYFPHIPFAIPAVYRTHLGR